MSVVYLSGGLEQAPTATAPVAIASDLWQFDPAVPQWTALPALPVGMYGHAMVFVPTVGPRGRIFMIGGVHGPAPYAPSIRVAIYDVATGQYLTALGNPDTQNTQAQLLANSASVPPRAGHGATFVPPKVCGAGYPLGIVVLFGGDVDIDSNGTLDGPANDLHYLDINTMTWDPTAVNISGSPPSPRCYTKMWFNGWNATTPVGDSHTQTNPPLTGTSDGVFTDLISTAPLAGTDVPGAYLSTESRAYLFGGTDTAFSVFFGGGSPGAPPPISATHFSDVHRLASSVPPNFAWQAVIPSGYGPSPNPRVVYNQLASRPEKHLVYLFGGSHQDSEFYNDVFRLRLTALGSEYWTLAANSKNPPTVRAYGSCESVGDLMYDFHGFFDSDGGTQTRMGPEGSNDSPQDWYNTVFSMGVQEVVPVVIPPGGSSSSGGSSGSSSGGGGGGGSSGGSGCFAEGVGSTAIPAALVVGVMALLVAATLRRRT